MRPRRFVTLLVLPLALFLAVNLVTWKWATEVLLTDKYDGGDLTRRSYILSSRYPRKNQVDLPRRHYLFDPSRRQQRPDVLVLGDSFAMGFGEGKNHFFQDYIATTSQCRVANVFPFPTREDIMFCSPLTNLILLYNSGMLDELRPRYVLLESVERYCIPRYSRAYDFGNSVPREKLVEFYRDKKYSFDNAPKVSFVNQGNWKFFYYNALYRFSDSAFDNQLFPIVYRELNRQLFSRNGGKILFLKEDVQNVPLASDANMARLNGNLNRMADLLAKKGIKFVFMPVVDKYDLYADCIVDNRYPRSTFFEKLRPLPKRYGFIDTKAILAEEVAKGVPDIFYPDDAHWSWKAPEKIFQKVRFQ